jgi:nucleolin
MTTEPEKEPKTVDQDEQEKEKAEDVEDGEDTKGKRKRKRKRKPKADAATEEAEKADDTATTTVPSSTNTKTAQVDRTVFVEGIPYTCTEQDIRDFFINHGLTDIEDIRLPVWQDSGRLRGYGHVVFADIKSQQAAVKECSGKYLNNRYLSVKPAEKPKAPGGDSAARPAKDMKPSTTIMLNNLSYEATEENIHAALEQFGTTVSGGIRVVRHSSTQRSKGFAYVEFESMDSAVKAFESTIIVNGRPCRVDYDHGRMKGSYRGADGKLWEKEFGGSTAASGGKSSNAANLEARDGKRDGKRPRTAGKKIVAPSF